MGAWVEATPRAAPAPPRGLLVPHNWTYIPKDADGNPLVKPGEKFRLLFLTNQIDAQSTDINDYNAHVQRGTPPSLRNFAEQFPGGDLHRRHGRARQHRPRHQRADLLVRRRVDCRHTWEGDDLFSDRLGRYHAAGYLGGGLDDTRALHGLDRQQPARLRAWGYGDLRFFAGARERVWVGNPRSTTGGGIVYAPDRARLPAADQGPERLPLYGISPVITVQPPSGRRR